jgi:hypothetical protein
VAFPSERFTSRELPGFTPLQTANPPTGDFGAMPMEDLRPLRQGRISPTQVLHRKWDYGTEDQECARQDSRCDDLHTYMRRTLKG